LTLLRSVMTGRDFSDASEACKRARPQIDVGVAIETVDWPPAAVDPPNRWN
jgi:hypothetical protein